METTRRIFCNSGIILLSHTRGKRNGPNLTGNVSAETIYSTHGHNGRF